MENRKERGRRMTDLKTLEARLDAALTALETAAAAGSGAAGDDSGAEAAARIAALEAENRELQDRLAAVTEEREKDLAQLDALIAQLRPLIEEAV
jgi:hypothetical protein